MLHDEKLDRLKVVVSELFGERLASPIVRVVDRYVRSMTRNLYKRTVSGKNMPPLEFLQKTFAYDPETGIVTYRVRPGKRGRGRVGAPAGYLHSWGYIRIDIAFGGRRYRLSAHRIGWALHHCALPPNDMIVHHKDEAKANNRIANLELITIAKNNFLVPYETRTKGWLSLLKNNTAPAFLQRKKAGAAFASRDVADSL